MAGCYWHWQIENWHAMLTDWIHQIAPANGVINLINKEIPDWPSLDSQRKLLSILQTVDSSKLPQGTVAPSLPHKYLHAILQAIQRDIEGRESLPEYDDDLIELVVEMSCGGGDAEDTGIALYKCLRTDRLLPITVKRSHNEVGTKVWTAGIFLTELVQRMVNIGSGTHPQQRCCSTVWKEKRVLELGAGVGITGIALGRGLPPEEQPSEVVLSDYPVDVMTLLDYNTTQASHSWNDQLQDHAVLSALSLDWFQVTESGFANCDLSSFDCILAADCTYSEDLNLHLVRLFDIYFRLYQNRSNSSSSPPSSHSEQIEDSTVFLPMELLSKGIPFVLIACTERNAATYAHFRNALDSSNVCKGIDISSSAHELNKEPFYIPNSDRSLVRILCILPR